MQWCIIPVWDVDSTISSSLHCSKYTSSSGCAGQSHIKVGTEWAGSMGGFLHIELFTIYLKLALVYRVKFKFLKKLRGKMQIVFKIIGTELEQSLDSNRRTSKSSDFID